MRDGDHYVVNGTKIWTTHAHFADRMFALVRTSDTPKRQEGISFLLIDMKTPGITIRPILTIGGDHEVNQVFFDDVRVPVENRVGEENKGWTYAKYLLEFERGAGFRATGLRRQMKELRELIARDGAARSPMTTASPRACRRSRSTSMRIEIIELKLLSDVQAGRNPGPISSVLKLRGTEVFQAITRLGVDVIGYNALVWEPRRPLYGLNEAAVLPEEELAILPSPPRRPRPHHLRRHLRNPARDHRQADAGDLAPLPLSPVRRGRAVRTPPSLRGAKRRGNPAAREARQTKKRQ